ncbi:MAG: hypothetical protein AB1696_23720 [Planctomycetota bacterium]
MERYDTQRPHERWIWTELIAFDNTQSDLGVGEYLDAAGFVPTALCLLMTTPDFILSYQGISEEAALPPDYCARDGHEFNRQRQRQTWTNHQLRELIRRLRERGIEVYVTVFTRFYRDRFHHEWVSDHREVFMVFKSAGPAWAINSLARLKDGTYYEDYFARQLVAVTRDYGFDGWHGADGYGPLNGPIYEVSFSDDMVGQFAEARDLDLPCFVIGECGGDVEKLKARAEWIWRNVRRDWIEFYADRWAGFWRKMVAALHGAGKKAVINSAWGRAPFESLYRYGIDYRKIVDAGVDGIVVETVAAGLAMDPRTADADRHYDFLSMLMLIKAHAPEAKLIFLHNTHDVVEQWDALRHQPTVLEREIYSLPNVYHTDATGRLKPCADGFLVCLGDAIARDEWAWLRENWRLAFHPLPSRSLGATLVWSDTAFRSQLDDFVRTRSWFPHRLLFHLMGRGALVGSTARIEALENVRGPILVLNPHIFPDEEAKRVFEYARGPIIAIGRKPNGLPPAGFEFEDVYPPDPLWCGVYGASATFDPKIEANGTEDLPADVMALSEPRGYWDHLPCRKVSDGFLDACIRVIQATCGISILTEADSVTLMVAEETAGRLRVAVKSKSPVYARPQVDMGKRIERVEVLSRFPAVRIEPEGSRFTVKVPGKGIVVLAVTLAGEK